MTHQGHDEAIRWDDEKGYCDFLTGIPVTPDVFEDTRYVLGGFAGNTDPDVYAAFRDYNADVFDEERYHTYSDYVETSVLNYEHLLRIADPSVHPDGRQAGEDEVQDLKFWYDKLKAEYDRLFPLCGACGQRHAGPEDCDLHPSKEERGVTVNVRVWVAEYIDNPVQMIRDLLHESDDCPWLSVLETWVDDPE